MSSNIMTRTASAAALGAALLIGTGLSAPPAEAGYVLKLTEQGDNVVATGSGAIDLTGLNPLLLDSSAITVMLPRLAVISNGEPSSATVYGAGVGITGPTSFGPGNFTLASEATGDIVGIEGNPQSNSFNVPILIVPRGYMSDAPLAGSSTYHNETFSSLGVTPDTYAWRWGSAANQNFTLDIVAPAAVPEPMSLSLFGLGLAGLALARRRRS